ncbi:MAG: transposase [Proteobacteria bacterium]|nr:transposase [Pseudomonadota bacterium]
MPDTFQPLATILQAAFNFNLSRIKCLVLLIEGLISARTVNLATLSAGMCGDAKVASNYKKLQRFMREVVFDWEAVARLLASFLPINNDSKWTLTMDRTNWKLGKVHINILYLAVTYRARSILRTGLDILQNLLANLHSKCHLFKIMLMKILAVNHANIA